MCRCECRCVYVSHLQVKKCDYMRMLIAGEDVDVCFGDPIYFFYSFKTYVMIYVSLILR